MLFPPEKLYKCTPEFLVQYITLLLQNSLMIRIYSRILLRFASIKDMRIHIRLVCLIPWNYLKFLVSYIMASLWICLRPYLHPFLCPVHACTWFCVLIPACSQTKLSWGRSSSCTLTVTRMLLKEGTAYAAAAQCLSCEKASEWSQLTGTLRCAPASQSMAKGSAVPVGWEVQGPEWVSWGGCCTWSKAALCFRERVAHHPGRDYNKSVI